MSHDGYVAANKRLVGDDPISVLKITYLSLLGNLLNRDSPAITAACPDDWRARRGRTSHEAHELPTRNGFGWASFTTRTQERREQNWEWSG